jgi:RND family efflux transporter MFP subunit
MNPRYLPSACPDRPDRDACRIVAALPRRPLLRFAPWLALGGALLGMLALPGLPVLAAEPAAVTAPATAAARTAQARPEAAFDGVVEALRQTVVASQVAGAVVQLAVKAGDRVTAGQLLLRIDARSAEQSAAASVAQLRAVQATLEVARREFERQQQLHAERFISSAALDRARAEFQAAQAQAAAQAAQLDVARTQTGLHLVRAPYAGIVSEVPVALGEMAMPGRALLTMYDPSALRVAASIPQTVAAALDVAAPARVELPGLPAAARQQKPARLQVLPAADAGTHTVTIRADLASGLPGAAPGQFARLWLPVASGAPTGPWVPLQAVVRRAEMTGLYVLDGAGRPLLRQVRLGRSSNGQVEVLAGLNAGEQVAPDGQSAARQSVALKGTR